MRVQGWLDGFDRSLASGDTRAVAEMFLDECYWRDFLSFTWNIKTLQGRPAIVAMLDATLTNAKPSNWAVDGEPLEKDGTTEAWFTFETKLGWGRGILRLKNGRCWTLLTTMEDLKGFEEKKGFTRPFGTIHQADSNRKTWGEVRAAELREVGRSEQPYCLIIGGGQGGVMLGARLRQLGVPTLIIDDNKRIGDSWRRRYRSLVLHDPVWHNHFPYIPFPQTWPIYTPKDKMGDWLEAYALAMELTCWTETRCISASFDEANSTWHVRVDRAGEIVELTPKQLVFATGSYGPPRHTKLLGMESFKGDIIHSTQYENPVGFAGKKVAIIGAAGSAHDIAIDLWEEGADVTMIQRSPIAVVRASTLRSLGFGSYSEEGAAAGVTTEQADLMGASMPFALVTELQKEATKQIRQRDAEFYRKLEASGMHIDFGPDETGLLMKSIRTGAGYYIDVGASDLIIEGKIKVYNKSQIKALNEKGILFENGDLLEVDAIFVCTGYHNMSETVAATISREMADKVGDVRGLGSNVKGDPGPWLGEPRNLWKPTAQESLWLHGGSLQQSRFYSKYVARQIKARMEGIPTPVYGRPEPGSMKI